MEAMADDTAGVASPPDLRQHDDAAPRYTIPSRKIGAVEVPAVVQDIDRAVRAFGRVPSLAHVSNLWTIPSSCFISSNISIGHGSSTQLYSAVLEP